MSLLAQTYEYDIEIRQFDEHASPEGAVIRASDIAEGFAYEKSGVKITAFEVDPERT